MQQNNNIPYGSVPSMRPIEHRPLFLGVRPSQFGGVVIPSIFIGLFAASKLGLFALLLGVFGSALAGLFFLQWVTAKDYYWRENIDFTPSKHEAGE